MLHEPTLYHYRIVTPDSEHESGEWIHYLVTDAENADEALSFFQRAHPNLKEMQPVDRCEAEAACGFKFATTSEVVNLDERRRA